jgi:hypothetical protein
VLFFERSIVQQFDIERKLASKRMLIIGNSEEQAVPAASRPARAQAPTLVSHASRRIVELRHYSARMRD